MTRLDVVLGVVILLGSGGISIAAYLWAPSLVPWAMALSVACGFWWGYKVGAR